MVENNLLGPTPDLLTRATRMIHTLLYIEDNPKDLTLVEHILSRHLNVHPLAAVTGTRFVRYRTD